MYVTYGFYAKGKIETPPNQIKSYDKDFTLIISVRF